jgi:hypothetical protein
MMQNEFYLASVKIFAHYSGEPAVAVMPFALLSAAIYAPHQDVPSALVKGFRRAPFDTIDYGTGGLSI